MSAADSGYYERLHRRLMAEGLSAREALAEVAEAYLDARSLSGFPAYREWAAAWKIAPV